MGALLGVDRDPDVSSGFLVIWADFDSPGVEDSPATSLVDLRFLPGRSNSLLLSRLLLRAGIFQSSPSAAGATSAEVSSNRAFSASSRCRRNNSSCSDVSFLTAASWARVDSMMESRKSTSSSSRERNWFFNLIFSSKASCLATLYRRNNHPNMSIQSVRTALESSAIPALESTHFCSAEERRTSFSRHPVCRCPPCAFAPPRVRVVRGAIRHPARRALGLSRQTQIPRTYRFEESDRSRATCCVDDSRLVETLNESKQVRGTINQPSAGGD